MPTSNGQVGSRDIRQKAIKQSHVFPAAIDTLELADLAVTVDKANDPLFGFAGEGDPWSNETLTTTDQELSSLTVDIPTWVGRIFVTGIALFQLTNTSGSDVLMTVSCRVNDADNFRASHEAVNNQTQVVTHFEVVGLSAPGSSVKISTYAKISTGTNTANQGRVWANVLGER